MAKFTYRVRDTQGRLISGVMEGSDVDDCAARLEEKAQIPISIEELNFDGTVKGRSFIDKIGERVAAMRNRVPYRDVVFFTRQLATMIGGGIALPKAVEQLSRNEKPVFRRVLDQIGDDLGMGSMFSDSLAKHPGTFNHMFVSVVRAGEAAGALDTVLDQLASYMENNEALKAKVKSAMRYPTIITLFITAIIGGIMYWLVPVFKEMYSGMSASLPAPTQVLISISDVIRNNIIVVLLLLVLLAALFITLLNIDATKRLYDRYVLIVPIFGSILKKNIMAIYCRTMSLLMGSGTQILESIQIAGAAVSNKHYAEALERVYDDVRQGELLSASLTRSEAFPVLVTQLVSTGEESGRMDELLQKAANFYDREIRNTVESLASIIEPVLLVVVGSVVGAILIALYLPIFTIGKFMG